MLKNYFIIAFRNIISHKLYSVITIFGLAVGMTCFLLVSGYIQYEKSYDDFHRNSKNIYRVDKVITNEGDKYNRAMTGGALAPLLIQQFPSIKNCTRFVNLYSTVLTIEGNYYNEKRFMFADDSVFKIFTFHLVSGNPANVLSDPFSVVLTEETAAKYYGNINPVGKTIDLQEKGILGKISYKITGIVKNIPSNSSIKFDFLASIQSLNSLANGAILKNWDGPVWTYVQLKNNCNPAELDKLFPDFAKKNIPNDGDINVTSLDLIPLDKNYYSRTDGPKAGDSGMQVVSNLLLVISILVLLIACFNFANLLNARSITRAREIGVRKVQGAGRFQVIAQFLSESVIISFASYIFAFVLALLLFPSFESFISDAYPTFNILPVRKVDINIINPALLLYLFAVTVIIGLLAGLYPALVLSGYNPVKVLKGEMREGRSSTWFRKSLVMAQFILAIILMNCSLIVINQISYWKDFNPGFDKNNIVSIQIFDPQGIEKYQIFKNSLKQNSGILGVTGSSVIPGGMESNYLSLRSGEIKDINVATYFVDYDFIKTMGLKLNGGRDFSTEFGNDAKGAFIVNKQAMNRLKWDGVNNQEIELYTTENNRNTTFSRGFLAGSINDFSYRIFDRGYDPLVLKIDTRRINYILVNIDKRNSDAAIDAIKSAWKEAGFNQPLEYFNLGDQISVISTFAAANSVIRFAAIVSIILASLGLFALTSFIVDRSRKEIGIRKVMGASVKNIVYRFAKVFMIPILMANIIAVPLSYKLGTVILQSLPNHNELNYGLLVVTTSFIVLLSMLVIGLKSIKAASTNPVESLRYE